MKVLKALIKIKKYKIILKIKNDQNHFMSNNLNLINKNNDLS